MSLSKSLGVTHIYTHLHTHSHTRTHMHTCACVLAHTIARTHPIPPPTVRSPCQDNYPADAHTSAHKSVLESANPAWTRSVHLDAPGQRHGQQPVSGTADPGVVKHHKPSRGSVGTTRTRSDPQRVGKCSGERPIGGAKGKQSNTTASCHPPPPRTRKNEFYKRNIDLGYFWYTNFWTFGFQPPPPPLLSKTLPAPSAGGLQRASHLARRCPKSALRQGISHMKGRLGWPPASTSTPQPRTDHSKAAKKVHF